jgi:hypothetical protein
MAQSKPDLLREIKSAFSLDGQEAEAAVVLLEARAASLDFNVYFQVKKYRLYSSVCVFSIQSRVRNRQKNLS